MDRGEEKKMGDEGAVKKNKEARTGFSNRGGPA
jgi:hypothetical protein